MSIFFPYFPLWLLTFLVSILSTRGLIWLNISAEPMGRSSHHNPTPSAGGVAIIIALSVGVIAQMVSFPWLLRHFPFYWVGYSVAVLLVGLVSFWDDCHPLSYRLRLLMHILGSIFLVLSGLVIQFPAVDSLNQPWLAQLLTIFCLVSLINGANFLDGLNGLLAGSVLINLVVILFMTPLISTKGIFVGLLIASILGFFVFNFPNAKIFMGDVGSTFLGLTLGFLALLSQDNSLSASETAWVHKSFVLTLMPMAFLWFDVGFTLLRRSLLARRLTEAHRDHLFHVLHDAGYSHAFVSSTYFFSVIVMGILSLGCYYSYISFMHLMILYTVLQIAFCRWVFKQSHAMAR